MLTRRKFVDSVSWQCYSSVSIGLGDIIALEVEGHSCFLIIPVYPGTIDGNSLMILTNTSLLNENGLETLPVFIEDVEIYKYHTCKAKKNNSMLLSSFLLTIFQKRGVNKKILVSTSYFKDVELAGNESDAAG